ncbi:hypothetical protein GCM10023329_41860 [Streptomyces sanyensis]|uniref:Tyr recombinase domain-containing protein n=1 Tax=Streptomyces sanyensis TaxID=568869 RepID=A0ABP9AZ45_9ACTN
MVLGLGCGLRQGEVFGLGPADIDDERGVLHVRRQVRTVGGKQYAALPKGAGARGVDLPDSVARELKRHLAAFPPREVELPWGRPEAGESVVTVARWLGRSSPAVALGYCAHVMPEAGTKGRAVLDGLLDSRRPGGNCPDSPQG